MDKYDRNKVICCLFILCVKISAYTISFPRPKYGSYQRNKTVQYTYKSQKILRYNRKCIQGNQIQHEMFHNFISEMQY